MYCPYCKCELKIKSGELYCKNRNNYFSKHIGKVFEEKIDGSQKIQGDLTRLDDTEEGRFYCVNCGEKMRRNGTMQEVCTQCGFQINKSMYYEITELNPHRSL
jgi:ribosomal protein L37AE/L43A